MIDCKLFVSVSKIKALLFCLLAVVTVFINSRTVCAQVEHPFISVNYSGGSMEVFNPYAQVTASLKKIATNGQIVSLAQLTSNSLNRVPSSLVVDNVGNHLYFLFGSALSINNTFELRRINPDGSGNTLIKSFSGINKFLYLDPLSRKIYLIRYNSIVRVNLNGIGIETVVAASSLRRGLMQNLAVDLKSGKLCWTQQVNDASEILGEIYCSNLYGSGIVKILKANTAFVSGIALDPLRNKVLADIEIYGTTSSRNIYELNNSSLNQWPNSSLLKYANPGNNYFGFSYDPIQKVIFFNSQNAFEEYVVQTRTVRRTVAGLVGKTEISAPALYNTANQYDVDRNGSVDSNDVQCIITFLQIYGGLPISSIPLSELRINPLLLNANGDNLISNNDAQAVISAARGY